MKLVLLQPSQNKETKGEGSLLHLRAWGKLSNTRKVLESIYLAVGLWNANHSRHLRTDLPPTLREDSSEDEPVWGFREQLGQPSSFLPPLFMWFACPVKPWKLLWFYYPAHIIESFPWNSCSLHQANMWWTSLTIAHTEVTSKEQQRWNIKKQFAITRPAGERFPTWNVKGKNPKSWSMNNPDCYLFKFEY